MTASYFPGCQWADFAFNGFVHSFAHLKEILIEAKDTAGVQRTIVVTYSDHVFTREVLPTDSHNAHFPGCSRNPGSFCVHRYNMSLELPQLIPQIPTQKVWCLTGNDRYANIPIVMSGGSKISYAIIFTLDKIKGIANIDARMHIRSAYVIDTKPPDTFGETRFAHLLALRMIGQHPKRNYGAKRRKPIV